MGFRLIRYEIESSSNPDILFLVEVWNQTSQDIHFSWSPLSNSWVIDNLGIRHNERIFNSFQNETVSPQEKILLQILSTSWTTFIDAEFVFQPEITEIYYTLDSLSRLDRASWRITIGK